MLQHVRRAFTLVEILVVVVILGIASAIILPQLSSRSDLVASAAARQLVADLAYAQNRAITLQVKQYVSFAPVTSTVGGSYTLMASSSGGSLTHPITKQPYVQTLGTASTGFSSVALSYASCDGNTVLYFDETGVPYSVPATGPAIPLSSGVVRLKSGDATAEVAIEPYTGALTVR
jgi:prepilin-type N-terminal cleavage/methylation domain-containing protein